MMTFESYLDFWQNLYCIDPKSCKDVALTYKPSSLTDAEQNNQATAS